MATQLQSGLATGSEGLVCFVCDVGVVGRYYTLATCRTQTTKVRLIEKLGQLVGEDYMVVISEDDVICRGCATMINSLDRLEKEVGSLRSIVLRYLEKKYDMDDGELVNARTNPPPSPATTQTKTTKDVKPESPTSFQARKRKFMEESNEELKELMNKDGKDCAWLQCDKCKYTTPSSSTVEQLKLAIKTEAKEAEVTVVCNQEEQHMNGIEAKVEIPEQIAPDLGRVIQDKEIMEVAPGTSVTPQPAVEMITAEMEEDRFVAGEATNATGLEVVTAPTSGGKQVTLQAVEAEDGTNTICMVDENGIIVQKVEQAEDGTLYVQMADGTDATKQVLSVAEDGSVQMVEVLWDDMVTTDDGTTMVTF